MPDLDTRLHAYRPDLADRALEGLVEAARFTDGVPHQVAVPTLAVRQSPRPTAAQDTVLLFGETVKIFDTDNGWAWIQNDADDYVGYVDLSALTPDLTKPTHRVSTLRTLVFPDNSIKSPPAMDLSFGSTVTATGSDRKMTIIALAGGKSGYVPTQHLAPVERLESDPIALAKQFLGAPYLWGGKSSDGLDCSALVQLAFNACGVSCPRDTDMQESGFGEPVDWAGDESVLKTGDCVFWPGHVGIWIDQDRFIHATAAFMKCVIEPLSTAIPRISSEAGLEVRAVRRATVGPS